MNLLLDTSALLWWFADDAMLPDAIAGAIDDPGNDILVSSASAWEICTKVRNGRLPSAYELSERFGSFLADWHFQPLAITIEHARLAGRLPGSHKDPFDRMLAAQALIEDVPLVTNDPAFAIFGVNVSW